MNTEAKTRNDDFKIELLPEHTPPFTPRHRFKLSQVDEIIRETQEKAKDWANHKEADRLRDFSCKLIDGLELMVKDGKMLKVPTFAIGPMNRKCFGKYDSGRNALGIPETVFVNEKRLAELENGAVALHLLMLLLCCWRHQTGGTGNFDGIAKDKLRSYGLTVGKKGVESIDPKGKFAKALSSGGIGEPPVLAPPAAGEGKSTNHLYSCNCQRARVGRGKFLAHCPMCGKEFLLGDHVGKYPEGTNVTDTPLAERQED